MSYNHHYILSGIQRFNHQPYSTNTTITTITTQYYHYYHYYRYHYTRMGIPFSAR